MTMPCHITDEKVYNPWDEPDLEEEPRKILSLKPTRSEPQMTLVTFGQYIAIKREALKLTRQEAAKRIGVSNAAYSKWELGANVPSRKCLEKLTTFYRLTEEELAPYSQLGQRQHHGNHESPIKAVINKAERAMVFIEEHMLGESSFEVGIKNKAIDTLLDFIDQLKVVAIIDEAF